jgi:hypothetical protein
MLATIIEELSGRGATAVFGLVLGALIAWLLGRWKRYQERQSILTGDARDTIAINHHLVETVDGPGGTKVPTILRIRSLGQAELDRVVPNGYLARVLLRRAFQVTPHDTLISIRSSMGATGHAS